jgi:integrase
MSVRKKVWRNAKGEVKESWLVWYSDQQGKPHTKTFIRKKDADAYHAKVHVEVSAGVHTPDSGSLTLAEAGEAWIKTCEANGLERATVNNYRITLRRHIAPNLGRVKLAQLSAPAVRAFEDKLRDDGLSATAVRVTRIRLGMLIADAQERGQVNRNVVRDLRRRKERKAERRAKGRLKVGVDIPTPDEVRALLPCLQGRWRPLLLTAIFCGLRGSELRGLRWVDVDLTKGELHVRQRADRYHKIGRPKSEAGERTVPVPPLVLNALKVWKLACPKSDLDLAFPNSSGKIESHGNIVGRGLVPAQVDAGITIDGKAKFTGLHALRHFFASWCINRRVDGGLELPLKVVQTRMGHSSIQMTADTYGHLFPAVMTAPNWRRPRRVCSQLTRLRLDMEKIHL